MKMHGGNGTEAFRELLKAYTAAKSVCLILIRYFSMNALNIKLLYIHIGYALNGLLPSYIAERSNKSSLSFITT